MKWLFYVIVFVYMFYRTVYGFKPVENTLITEPSSENVFLRAGDHKTISCRASNRNQRAEWLDPNGHVVKRIPGSRIFSQEHFVPAMRGKSPALVLTITKAMAEDSGVYMCRSGTLMKNVSLCVIEPSDFADTPLEVVADVGRAITLTCQAKGEPEPRISWSRNGETIEDDDSTGKYKVMTKYNIQGFEGLLTITSLEPEDSGIYSCLSIQENPDVEECSYALTFNITLNINYAPTFEDGNKTKLVFGNLNEEVDLVCAADGYPTPSYRFFRELRDDIMFEYDNKQIKLSEDGAKAVLTVVANQTTYWQRFKCQASNEHGDSEKYFTVMKIEKPKKPEKVEVYNATSDSVVLNITWAEEVQFPINGFEVQFVEQRGNGRPTMNTWKKSTISEIEFDEHTNIDPETNGLVVELEELEPETTYWYRVRVKNDEGVSLWTDAGLASTISEEEEATTTTTEDPEAEPEVADNEESMNEATFYGIFFAGGIFVVTFVCVFILRLVK